MGNSASDQDLWLMESTPLSELIEDEGQKLTFVFDYLTERSFFMELKEMIPSRSLVEPVCTFKLGKAPKQTVDMDEFDRNIDAKLQQTAIDDMDIESIDETAFDDEELNEGFDIMNL